ncbi:MAG: ASCH domain-containing protein [Bacilli bacterium]|nr:ASCH domain-containing protein [Bacilli bacterium]
MKVLTIKQPWATLITEGIKKYEFRSWKTKYRGKVLIHAGAGIDKEAMKELKDYNFDYPSKKIIAEVEIVDCLKLDDELNKKIISEKNIAYGSKKRDGYVWVLDNVKKIDSNKTINGKLGLWNIDL